MTPIQPFGTFDTNTNQIDLLSSGFLMRLKRWVLTSDYKDTFHGLLTWKKSSNSLRALSRTWSTMCPLLVAKRSSIVLLAKQNPHMPGSRLHFGWVQHSQLSPTLHCLCSQGARLADIVSRREEEMDCWPSRGQIGQSSTQCLPNASLASSAQPCSTHTDYVTFLPSDRKKM